MTKVLVTAEAFGFGPASKLHAVCVELARRGIECHFVGVSVAATFAQSNADAFASIRTIDAMAELQHIPADGFDATISVMDPYLALWSSVHGVPCVYVDSLFWFWQWPTEREDELQDTARRLRSRGGIAEAFAELGAVPMHDSEYVAHYLSSVSCVQRTPKTTTRTRSLSGLGPIHLVDAVIDLSHRTSAAPTRWLATTSGLVNSLLPTESAVEWIGAVAQLVEEAADISGVDEPITFAGNPSVLKLCSGIASKRIVPMPLSHGDILCAMNGAVACLTPPGLTTMLECAAYGTPVIMLPEQHYGHLSNYEVVTGCGRSEDFPHALINPNADGPQDHNVLGETLAVSEQLKLRFDRRDEVWNRMVSGLADGMRRALCDRQNLQKAQEAAVRKFVGGFSGATQVTDVVQALIDDGDAAGLYGPAQAQRVHQVRAG